MRGTYRKRFKEEIHEEERAPHTRVHGKLLWFLFTKLQKFNDPAEEVVFGLLPEGRRHLDVGCGDGRLCSRAKGKFEEIFGMDIAENRIRRAKKRNPHAHFMVADLDEMLPFKSGMLDVVTCIATFYYCIDPYHVIKEFYRVLKEDGILVLQVTNIAWLPYRVRLLFGDLFTTSLDQRYGWDGEVLHYFTFKAVEDFLKGEGFRIVTRTGSGIFPKWRRWWLPLLSSDIIIKAVKI